MDYMNDPNLKVVTKEARGMDVKDITGGRNGQSLSNTMERVQPIKPRSMEYDIINPAPKDNAALRMSSYGKNVLSSRQRERTTKIIASPPAGKLHLAKMGEANIDQIWPADSHHRSNFNEKNRTLDTGDINKNIFNARQTKIKE